MSSNPQSAISNPQFTVAAVIAAGGTGSRMTSTVPKQFLELAGKPILLHSIESVASLESVIHVVVALPARHIPRARAILGGRKWRVPVKLVSGGATRQESVRRGVWRTPVRSQVILVHDAVRPICDRETMQRVLDAAWTRGAAVPGLPATETIQRVSSRGRVLATPPREELFGIQTPQCFHASILRKALERAHKSGFLGTDESSVVRWSGHSVFVVPGSQYNIKITRPFDLEVAELLMSGNVRKETVGTDKSIIRIGQGIDYHRLVQGRKLILGGVSIPFEKGLEGHSDADALSHAICDAVLGASALGDIGRHFPDNDPENKGRSSLEFLKEVGEKASGEGWAVLNVDATLLAQNPRLAPYMENMRQNIAEALGISPAAVNIKATTTEGMNAEGRGEGISSQAVVLLERRQY
ncbi:MAG TPA: 2-C-methyl-D-erythritol 4-phosphate cytidylyltransferase [Acidobacteriota bacterium]|nr:2-C-methyl-D-erythritol 4-phosphate cytidylyltransferase [Acidobacteriota bacterium]